MQENWFVVVMGIGMVFVVLALIIVLCSLLGALVKSKDSSSETEKAPMLTDTAIPNRTEFVAAVSAAIAEASGTDASAIRILSIKKL